jgi:hypothetical protein
LEQATPKKRSARYEVEIRDAAGVSLLLTRGLKLVGFKAAAAARRQEIGCLEKRRRRRLERSACRGNQRRTGPGDSAKVEVSRG